MEYSMYTILIYFIIYSMAGWLLESTYRSICEKKLINTGFLYGPFCPIYGTGAIIMLLFLKRYENNVILLFLISFFILSIWEYIVGVMLEKMFKTKYWDYSNNKFNIKGRVCLFNSLCWGALGVIFIKYLHPYIEDKLQYINPQIIKYVFASIMLIIAVDMVISVIKARDVKDALEKIEELNKQIKEKIDEIKHVDNKHLKDDILEGIQAKIDNLKVQKNQILINAYKRIYRLKKKFPTIQSKEITAILNIKKDILKKDKTKEEK